MMGYLWITLHLGQLISIFFQVETTASSMIYWAYSDFIGTHPLTKETAFWTEKFGALVQQSVGITSVSDTVFQSAMLVMSKSKQGKIDLIKRIITLLFSIVIFISCSKKSTSSDQINYEDISCVDIDGNVYETILIGDQLWMSENLKVTHYSNGDPINSGFTNSDWSNLDVAEMGAYTVYPWDEDEHSIATCEGNCTEVYGNLYNWYAVYDERRICPEGFHVPADGDWMLLEMFLGMNFGDALNMYFRGTDEGSQLAGANELWINGYLESDPAFGTSGLNILPGGYRDGGGGYFSSIGTYTMFWSSTPENNIYAWDRALINSNSQVKRMVTNKQYGCSVRCVGDETP